MSRRLKCRWWSRRIILSASQLINHGFWKWAFLTSFWRGLSGCRALRRALLRLPSEKLYKWDKIKEIIIKLSFAFECSLFTIVGLHSIRLRFWWIKWPIISSSLEKHFHGSERGSYVDILVIFKKGPANDGLYGRDLLGVWVWPLIVPVLIFYEEIMFIFWFILTKEEIFKQFKIIFSWLIFTFLLEA